MIKPSTEAEMDNLYLVQDLMDIDLFVDCFWPPPPHDHATAACLRTGRHCIVLALVGRTGRDCIVLALVWTHFAKRNEFIHLGACACTWWNVGMLDVAFPPTGRGLKLQVPAAAPP